MENIREISPHANGSRIKIAKLSPRENNHVYSKQN